MMKNMILPIAFTALIASMTACSDETDPHLDSEKLGRYSHILPIE